MDVPQENTSAIKLPESTTSEAQSNEPPAKRIRCLVVDSGPLIKNDPNVNTLLASAEEIYTIPSVISEIRDEATRSRLETALRPFLKLRSPRPDSIKFVTDFARRTGDLEVLSKPDIHLVALTYELECEKNGGDWRLRKTPGQKELNGPVPGNSTGDAVAVAGAAVSATPGAEEPAADTSEAVKTSDSAADETAAAVENGATGVEAQLGDLSITPSAPETTNPAADDDLSQPTTEDPSAAEAEGSDSDSDGWIMPSNLKKHQEKDAAGGSAPKPIETTLAAAILTSDYAMQNISLRINLHLLSPALARITRVKQWVLRCHGCFATTRLMDKQFCPKCGQPTLTRVSCSTDAQGNFKVHLKKNYQYNKRGNVYSVPKPTHGTASGKSAHVKGGGKHGWGNELILAEDQKEYVRRAEEDKRMRVRDLMDEDYLPNLLSGDRTGGHGRIRVGAGRNVNSKKRR